MTHKNIFTTVFFIFLIIMFSPSVYVRAETKSNETKTEDATTEQPEEQAVTYPEKLIKDFPKIYSDTAYTCDDYSVVVRAVWMSQRGRKTKVTSPDQLPMAITGESFISFETHDSPTHENTTFNTESNADTKK